MKALLKITMDLEDDDRQAEQVRYQILAGELTHASHVEYIAVFKLVQRFRASPHQRIDVDQQVCCGNIWDSPLGCNSISSIRGRAEVARVFLQYTRSSHVFRHEFLVEVRSKEVLDQNRQHDTKESDNTTIH